MATSRLDVDRFRSLVLMLASSDVSQRSVTPHLIDNTREFLTDSSYVLHILHIFAGYDSDSTNAPDYRHPS